MPVLHLELTEDRVPNVAMDEPKGSAPKAARICTHSYVHDSADSQERHYRHLAFKLGPGVHPSGFHENDWEYAALLVIDGKVLSKWVSKREPDQWQHQVLWCGRDLPVAARATSSGALRLIRTRHIMICTQLELYPVLDLFTRFCQIYCY